MNSAVRSKKSRGKKQDDVLTNFDRIGWFCDVDVRSKKLENPNSRQTLKVALREVLVQTNL